METAETAARAHAPRPRPAHRPGRPSQGRQSPPHTPHTTRPAHPPGQPARQGWWWCEGGWGGVGWGGVGRDVLGRKKKGGESAGRRVFSLPARTPTACPLPSHTPHPHHCRRQVVQDLKTARVGVGVGGEGEGGVGRGGKKRTNGGGIAGRALSPLALIALPHARSRALSLSLSLPAFPPHPLSTTQRVQTGAVRRHGVHASRLGTPLQAQAGTGCMRAAQVCARART